MSPYREPSRKPSTWCVVAQQSVFLPQFVLGRWDKRWRAVLAGWWYTFNNPHSAVWVFKGWVEERT